MTQAEKDKIIAELQEKLAEAEKIKVDKTNLRWKPNEDEDYYSVGINGVVFCAMWQEKDPEDQWRYLTGNCFKTQEEAEEYKKQIEYTARYKNYIEEHSEPIDWEVFNQNKYLAFFDFRNHSVSVDWGHLIKKQGTIYASSEKIIWDAIKEIGEDNFKKYVLEVK